MHGFVKYVLLTLIKKQGAVFIYTKGMTTNIVWLNQSSGGYRGNFQSFANF